MRLTTRVLQRTIWTMQVGQRSLLYRSAGPESARLVRTPPTLSLSSSSLSSSPDWDPGIGTPNRLDFFQSRDGRNQKTDVIKN